VRVMFLGGDVDQIWCSVFSSDNPLNDPLGMSYFDDSGHKDDTDFVVAAGFSGRLISWLPFEQEWKNVLARFGLTYFHMVTLKGYKGEFAQFKNRDRLMELSDALIGCIEKYAEFSTGALVDVAAYNKMNQEFFLQESVGVPFALAGSVATHRAVSWLEKAWPKHRWLMLFESGTDGWDEMSAECFARWGNRPHPANYIDQIPVQAADVLAWELNRVATQVKAKTVADIRGSFGRLVSHFTTDHWIVLNELNLHTIVKSGKVLKRR